MELFASHGESSPSERFQVASREESSDFVELERVTSQDADRLALNDDVITTSEGWIRQASADAIHEGGFVHFAASAAWTSRTRAKYSLR